MLVRLARAVVRRRRAVIVATLVLMALAGLLGGKVVSRLSGGGFTVPGSPSQLAANALAGQFHAGEPNFVLIVESPRVHRCAGRDHGGEALSAGARPSEVRDPRGRLLVGRPSLDDAQPERPRRPDHGVHPRQRQSGDQPRHAISQGSSKAATARSPWRPPGPASSTRRYLTASSTTSPGPSSSPFPITFVLLVLVFGGLVAALMPLVVGVVAIVGTLLVLRVLTGFTEVSVYSLNITTGLGLGLGDRLQPVRHHPISRGADPIAQRRGGARGQLSTSAGRTVLFSAVTVALSLSALFVFPLYFLRSFAYAGIAVVLIAAIGAVVLLPAVLAVLGQRIDALTIFRRRPADATHGFWQRLAEAVMRRPVLAGGAVLAVLLVLGIPFLSIRFGLPDDRVLPRSDPAQQASQLLRTSFPDNSAVALQVVDSSRSVGGAALGRYAAALSRLDGVTSVQSAVGTFAGGGPRPPGDRRPPPLMGPTAPGFSSTPTPRATPNPASTSSSRSALCPAPAPFLVGGASAQLLDTEHSIGSRLPLAGLIVALAMFLVLFLFTGSLVDPAEGDPAQPAQPVGQLRRDGLHLPARTPAVPRRPSHRHGDCRHYDALAHVLCGIRLVHGLRGFPALAHSRDLPRDRRQPACCGRRARAHREAHHRRRGAHRRGLADFHHEWCHLPQAARTRHGARCHCRRHACTRCARAGVHAPCRRLELVGARPDAPLAHTPRSRRARGAFATRATVPGRDLAGADPS